MGLNEREAITDGPLLVKSGVVLLAVFVGFVGHSAFHIAPSVVALLGAGTLVLIAHVEPRDYMPSVEWQTLLFFAGLFILVGSLVKTGVIEQFATSLSALTQGNALLAVMVILVASAVLSGVIDNIPYVATMSPIVVALTRGIPDPVQADAVWWALALGADFGGNATAVGASANVVVLGIALRAGHPISFWEFTRKGLVVTAVTVAVAAVYLWVRYFLVA
jgi:Na+/H+ antiporter NhaD/arsenite permease-like protein